MYHILYENDFEAKNIFDVTDEELNKILHAYETGKDSFYLRGEIHSFRNLLLLNIFESDISIEEIKPNLQEMRERGMVSSNYPISRTGYINKQGMLALGKDVSMQLLLKDFGEDRTKSDEEEIESPKEDRKTHETDQQIKELNFDYAIITALYKDELKFIEPYINYEGEVKEDNKKLIRYGSLKSNDNIKIVYASLLNTGMVEAAIVATEIITRFNPKILIMPGVCGGRDQDNLGVLDIVVANGVYTFNKGKIKNGEFELEWEGEDLNDKLIQIIQTNEEEIIASFHFEGQVHYEKVACSSFVVDEEGLFETIAQLKDRKTIALEMESYGIARACSIVNNGYTRAIIIKAIMDKTQCKNDDHKKLAAKNSADFAMKLIELGILN